MRMVEAFLWGFGVMEVGLVVGWTFQDRYLGG